MYINHIIIISIIKKRSEIALKESNKHQKYIVSISSVLPGLIKTKARTQMPINKYVMINSKI